tara:strand:- start:1286 stop:2134 length:849 start_codon:yes stop_codon:yes gene_type:complete
MNYLEALNYGNSLLKKNNITSYSLDSELLLASALNSTRERLLISLEKKIKKKICVKYKKLIFRRKNNEPIAYILNKKEFWKFTFFVNKHVLIPRPETEILVEETLKLVKLNSSKSILDVGTGSGCIIISLIKERPNCKGTAIDVSNKAVKIAKINAKMHHLQNKINIINIDIDKFHQYKYDFIVSNPPYINKFDFKRLEKDIKFYEPKLALEAGINGLSEIEKLIIKSKILLKNKGKLIFEIGSRQKEEAKFLLKKNGFYINKVCYDINSHPRVIISTKLYL